MKRSKNKFQKTEIIHLEICQNKNTFTVPNITIINHGTEILFPTKSI